MSDFPQEPMPPVVPLAPSAAPVVLDDAEPASLGQPFSVVPDPKAAQEVPVATPRKEEPESVRNVEPAVKKEVPVTATPLKETPKSFFAPLYESPDIKFDDDPTAFIKSRTASLIFWEKPKKSAAVLGSTLTILILTQYYSVLQLVSAFFTIVTGLNWIYVNTHKQGQKVFNGRPAADVTNPHSARLAVKTTLVSRDRVVRSAQLAVDVIETLARQVTKLVLIEDNTRSLVALGVSYSVWTLAKHIATKYLFGVFVVSAFLFPRLYLQHKDIIDTQVTQHSQKAYTIAQQYGGVANETAKQYYSQALRMVKKTTVQTKKAE
ncbi:Reticulon-domain-containing protein [Phycomyces nitens]|nr:Reticulon-domain-containing protein [Phycomyces nitens]